MSEKKGSTEGIFTKQSIVGAIVGGILGGTMVANNIFDTNPEAEKVAELEGQVAVVGNALDLCQSRTPGDFISEGAAAAAGNAVDKAIGKILGGGGS